MAATRSDSSNYRNGNDEILSQQLSQRRRRRSKLLIAAKTLTMNENRVDEISVGSVDAQQLLQISTSSENATKGGY
ncbi:unnamed protein product [Linum trigynum]|uniref:Uncharacterized protein n=1 Tax=Linum trigynum TaxID=586398 RepID=A0AAV2D9H3_9ROSI